MAIAKHKTEIKACGVMSCENESERSISGKLVSKSSLKLKPGGVKNIPLCKEHYKEYKKKTKKSRELDNLY